MLKIMRSHKFFTVFLLSAVTIMIIITFVFWGIGPLENPSNMVVAHIGKEKITQKEYWKSYYIAEDYYRRIYKDEEEIKKLNLKEMVLNDLIDRKVLMIAADMSGVKVTQEELKKAIMSNPLFQKNGVFQRDVYMRALKLMRMTPREYENALMDELLIDKMSRVIGETTELTTDERKILDSIKEGREQLAQAFLSAKQELAIKAYIEGVKRQMKIKINEAAL